METVTIFIKQHNSTDDSLRAPSMMLAYHAANQVYHGMSLDTIDAVQYCVLSNLAFWPINSHKIVL